MVPRIGSMLAGMIGGAVVVVVVGTPGVVVAVGSSGISPSGSGRVPSKKAMLTPKFSANTGRNESSPVVPTASRARSRSSTPGSCTRILRSPWMEISGSWTLPMFSIRSRMISTAFSRTSRSAPSGAVSTTEKPPRRSRPSSGDQPAVTNPARDPQAMPRVSSRVTTSRRRITPCLLQCARQWHGV